MLQASVQVDPLVEVLRLAYRRGLAIQREQSKIACVEFSEQVNVVAISRAQNLDVMLEKKEQGDKHDYE